MNIFQYEPISKTFNFQDKSFLYIFNQNWGKKNEHLSENQVKRELDNQLVIYGTRSSIKPEPVPVPNPLSVAFAD